MIVYVGLSTGIVSIACGFLPQGTTIDVKTLILTIVYILVIYVTVSILSVLTATSIRNMGGSITATVIILLAGFIAGVILLSNSLLNSGSLTDIPAYHYLINPLLMSSLSSQTGILVGLFNLDVANSFWFSLLSNILYSALFLGLGILIFNYRDVK